MTINRITREQFTGLPNVHLGRTNCTESVTVRKLPFDQGVSMSCRWRHYRAEHHCGGVALMHHVARRNGFLVSTRCMDGVLYVWKTSKGVV